MPFAEHVKVSAIGVIGAPPDQPPNDVEAFSYGFSMAGVSLNANLETLAGDIATDVAAFHGRAETGISQNARLLSVKVARIGVDGKYTADAIEVPLATRGGAGFSPYPPQIALVISLLTERRGPTGKGRFYLPLPSQGLANDGNYLISTAQRAACEGSAEQLLSDLNNLPGIDAGNFGMVVASSKGYNTPVSGVRVGRALDTIRSRRRSLSEGYGSLI